MLDVKLIVEQTEYVKAGLLKRMKAEDLDLDTIIRLYNEKKAKLAEFEKARTEQNSFNDKMSQAKKGSPEFMELVGQLKELSAKVKSLEEEASKLDQELTKKIEVLPNVPDEDLLPGEKENNKTIKEWGKLPEFDFEIKDHLELGMNLGLLDMDKAVKLAGTQFAMYTGAGAQLEWALINYFIEIHIADGYQMVMPPHLLLRESAYTAGQLPKFEEDVYWTQDGTCLLPTAETALVNLYRDEILEEKDLPKKFFAYTPCYRREAGGYRANERGLMRTHQFNKVEMVQYTTDTGSAVAFDELVEKACKLVEGLGLHYRISKLAAGDCSAGMARTYDIEVYLPFLKTYYEVSSVSNAKEYQARRGNMRYKPADGGKTKFVHTLNGSGLATSRLMVSLLETYQNADGSITVPEVLRKFVGKDKI